MLALRLSRLGKNKKPIFRLVVSEKSKDTFGDHLEILGYYNPRTNPKIVNLNKERIKYWLGVGAKTSATIHNLLVDQKIIEGPKVKVSKIKKKKVETPKEEVKGETKFEAKETPTTKEKK